MKMIGGVPHVDSEAIEGMARRPSRFGETFNEEDLMHLADVIFDAQGGGSAGAMPGAEHVYAKVYRAVHGRLPPVARE